MNKNLLKYALMCNLLVFMFSCEQEMIKEPESDISTITKSTVNNDYYYMEQIEGIPVNIYLAQPYGSGKYIGIDIDNEVPSLKRQCVLKSSNSSSFEKWILRKIDLRGSYYPCYRIDLVGSLPEPFQNPYTIGNDLEYLVVKNPDFFTYPNETSCFFTFKKIENTNNEFYIYATCVTADENYPPFFFDRVAAEGIEEKSKIYSRISNSGDPFEEYQYRWKISPAELYDIVDIEYHMEPGDIISEKPNFITTTNVVNGTSIEQSMTATFTEKATESSRFSKTEGVTISFTSGTKVGIPNIIDSSLEMGVTTSESWSFEESESKEDSRTYTFPVRVPPRTTVTAQASVQMYEADVTYVATFKGRTSGREVVMSGKWQGVKASTINYILREATSNRILKSFSGIPNEIVDLTK